MSNPYSLLKPVKTDKPPREAVQIHLNITDAEVYAILESMEELVSVDIETKGNKVHTADSKVVGVGIADSTQIHYFCIKSNPEIYLDILRALGDKTLLGFNINFDAGYFHRDWSAYVGQPNSGPNLQWHDWKYDVYGLFKQLSNEGWAGQEWNLKSAQIDLLNWDSKGNEELGQWLVDNGYFSSTSLEYKPDYFKRYVENSSEGRVIRWCKPEYSEMHNAPSEILGYYCGLDAASTYMLFAEVFEPAVSTLPDLAQANFWFYHCELFITNAKWHIEQQLRGIRVDRPELEAYTLQLADEIDEAEEEFYNHPVIEPHIQEWNKQQVAARLGNQPAEFTKAGKPSKNYINWLDKRRRLEGEQLFNMNSGKQREWMFYERLKYPVILRTEKGNPAVDKKALLAWGEPGQILKRNNDKTKELGYVQSCIDMLRASEDGYIHPQYRLPGTLTCRIAGAGSFNIQQQPKSKNYLKHWRPRDGMVWVDADVESLEAVVLAELSKDNTMRYLYDPNSPRNDIYLYVGSFLPGIKEAILSAGYNPESPTIEGITAAKTLAKKERQIAKTCVLGFQYGMGPKKLKQSLALEGINLTDDEAFEIYKAYWDLFGGIKEFNKHLEAEWRRRGGWVYNGIGRPVTCYEPYLRDINNRVVQSTGHDILMYVNYQLYQLRNETGLDFHGIIIDWHDASLVECKIEDGSKVVDVFNEAYKRLNDWLKGDLKIRTKANLVYSLAESKCE